MGIRRWRRPWVVVCAAVVMLAGLGGGAWAYRTLSEPCAGAALQITIVAQTEIAPALREIANRFGTQRHRIQERCVEVQILPESSAETAAGLGKDAVRADGWVPESAVWFTVARNAGADETLIPAINVPLAGSPVVLATTVPARADLDAAGVEPSWGLLLESGAAGIGLDRRMLDPASNTTGTFAMIALDQVADPGRGAIAEMRRNAPKTAKELLGGLTGPERFDRPLIVASEQAIIAYNETHRPNPAVVLTPKEGTLMLDFPFAAITKDQLRREAVDAFASALRSRSSRETLQRYGFRAPDGTLIRTYARRHQVDSTTPKPLKFPTQREIDRAFRSWRTIGSR